MIRQTLDFPRRNSKLFTCDPLFIHATFTDWWGKTTSGSTTALGQTDRRTWRSIHANGLSDSFIHIHTPVGRTPSEVSHTRTKWLKDSALTPRLLQDKLYLLSYLFYFICFQFWLMLVLLPVLSASLITWFVPPVPCSLVSSSRLCQTVQVLSCSSSDCLLCLVNLCLFNLRICVPSLPPVFWSLQNLFCVLFLLLLVACGSLYIHYYRGSYCPLQAGIFIGVSWTSTGHDCLLCLLSIFTQTWVLLQIHLMEVDVSLSQLVRTLSREDHHAVRLLPDVLWNQVHSCHGWAQKSK